jgi:Rrf2 family transcriptional regulator, nitric oxide-sensitive transcriptional repressor
MRLTRFSDNALRCLIVLGLEPDECITVQAIATRMNMSYEHLVKIVQRLAELGYVETVRGRHGGVRLAMPADRIRLGDLVRKTEENLTLVECFDPEHNTCPIASACQLAPVLNEALSAFMEVLNRRTLADALQPHETLVTLLRRNAGETSTRSADTALVPG